jgi:hypothetical protein
MINRRAQCTPRPLMDVGKVKQRLPHSAAAMMVIVLCSCASVPAVHLENAAGEKAECGPFYSHLGFFLERVHETEQELSTICVTRYEGRGFHRVTAPADMPAR